MVKMNYLPRPDSTGELSTASLEREMVAQGLAVSDVVEGKWVNVSCSTDKKGKKSGYYIVDLMPDGCMVATYGSFKENWKKTWCSKSSAMLSDEDIEAHKAMIESQRAKIQKNREIQQKSSASDASRFIESLRPATDKSESQYLQAKGINPNGSLINGNNIIIPGLDADGNIWTYQSIDPFGEKTYMPGGRKQGSMFVMGDLEGAKRILVSEGFSTAASIRDACGEPCVAAFDAKNLQPVCESLRSRYPYAEIIICADDDRWGKSNTGISTAASVSSIVDNCRYISPKFSNTDTRPTDFCDLLAIDGPKAVYDQIMRSDRPISVRPFSFKKMGETPKRSFLYGNFLARGFVSVTIASGGTGKTSLDLTDCVSMCLGKKLTYCDPHEKVNCWHFNLEDDYDELNRRLWGIHIAHGINEGELDGKLFISSGVNDKRLIVAEKAGKDGIIAKLDNIDFVVDFIRKNNIGYLCVDPFVKSHQLDENDNMAVDFVMDQFKKIAHDTNCSINLLHHTPKIGNGVKNEEIAGNSEMARGGGAIIGAARTSRTMLLMDKDEASKLGVDVKERYSYVRIDSGKSNIAKKGGNANWMKFLGQDLPNGDKIGVLKQWDKNSVSAEIVRAIGLAKINLFIDNMSRGYEGGKSYTLSKAGQSSAYIHAQDAFRSTTNNDEKSRSVVDFLLSKNYLIEQTEALPSGKRIKTVNYCKQMKDLP